MKEKIKKTCTIGMLTALYVVMSAFIKVPVFGHIVIDLGYFVFSCALSQYGVYGAIVGVVGCSLESILFTEYGFSLSWFVGNIIIGIGCGLCFSRQKKTWQKIIVIILFVFFGMFVAKTVIDCALYSIPIVVKAPKSATAFLIDSLVMICGVVFWDKFGKKITKSAQI